MSFDDALVLSIDWLFANAEQSRLQSGATVYRDENVSDEISIDPVPESVQAGRAPISHESHSAPTAVPVSAMRHSSYDLSCPICFEVNLVTPHVLLCTVNISRIFVSFSSSSLCQYYNDRIGTPCRHFFCRACILDYMRTTPGQESECLCPMCRERVVSASQYPYMVMVLLLPLVAC